MLTGQTTRFWAESYGGDPFAPGPVLVASGTFAADGPHQPYVARYIHPFTGDVAITLARLPGFSADDQAGIHRLWTAGRR